MTMGEESANLSAAERGQLDLVRLFATASSERFAALRTPIGARLHSGSFAMTEYAWLNTQSPPFDDPRVRRALNLAIDRGKVAELTGGREAGSPTCQVLPVGLPGYRPVCPFTLAPSPSGAWAAPDRAEARRLITASGSRGTPVEVWTYRDRRELGRHLAGVLRDLGFRTRLRVFAEGEEEIAAVFDRRQRSQVGIMGWVADFPESAGFLRTLVACDGGFNLSHFCDRRVDAAINRAQAAGGTGAAWQRRRAADRRSRTPRPAHQPPAGRGHVGTRRQGPVPSPDGRAARPDLGPVKPVRGGGLRLAAGQASWVAWVGSPWSGVAVQLVRRFSVSSDLEPGSTV